MTKLTVKRVYYTCRGMVVFVGETKLFIVVWNHTTSKRHNLRDFTFKLTLSAREPGVCRRQILTSKVYTRAERVKY